ncbi:MAG TPA: glycine cleavage system protein GcvH [Candidatus Latescibacteria bacterium]|nr:glycine cleavage system protein GcvH [Candidatus Latescibacterota bacterium]HIM55726.1 glycine cleavage system protein GcvH [Candidatus Latescibacterota bacterium]
MSEDLESGIPEELRYSEQHEWVSLDDDAGTIGITDYAQTELGDIVFVELPEVGERFEKGQAFGSVEAVKAVEDLYCPIAGEVVEVNDTLEEGADQVNGDPYGSGWMIKLRLDNPADADGLLSAADYASLIEDA